MGRQTQTQAILDYMKKNGSISSREAFMELGVGALAARIRDLKKQGIAILSKTEEIENRYGTKSRYSRYYIKTE